MILIPAQDVTYIGDLLNILNDPKTKSALDSIYQCYRETVGESRYFTVFNLKQSSSKQLLRDFKTNLQWIKPKDSFRVMPPVFTLDAYIFDNMIYHGGDELQGRFLPKGLDIFASFGSEDAKRILIDEFKENRFPGYEIALNRLATDINNLPDEAWSANLYQNWLNALKTLIKEPSPEDLAFCKSKGWKRKELNTALGSWVNLRYETIAIVEQAGAECGEAGYEVLNVGLPRGYVEPNPEFYRILGDGFKKIQNSLENRITDKDLRNGVVRYVEEYRKQIESLEIMARKELKGELLTDEEYSSIFNIGGVVEHFILLMRSLNVGDGKNALNYPDPINKIADVQYDESNKLRLYEALGFADEINVATPFFGKRQIVKGPVYSYYEFASNKNLNTKQWVQMKKPHPIWISPYYEGQSTTSLGELQDLK